MFKNKTIKLFIILGVILFSLVGVVGCTNPTGSDNVNATYIKTSVEIGKGNNQFKVVNNRIDLVTLLENNTPEKYNEDFFKTKSLLVFEIFEESGGNRSEIESYEIMDKTLNVYVKIKQYGVTTDIGIWCFILELSKEEVETFDNVNIFKNGEEIMSGLNTEIELIIKKSYISNYCSDLIGLDEIIIEEYYGCYNNYYVILIKELNKGDTGVLKDVIIEGLTFKYPFGNRGILLWKSDEFISLDKAYEKGLIQKDELIKLHQIFNN